MLPVCSLPFGEIRLPVEDDNRVSALRVARRLKGKAVL